MEQALGIQHLVGADAGPMLWWQMCIRALVILLFGLLLVRLAGKRVFGKWGAIDIIVSVIIGSNLSRALTGSAPLIATLAATAMLVALHWLLTTLAARMNWLGPVLKGRPVRLISRGEVDARALRREGVGANDLEEALRCAGVEGPGQVDSAWLERNGQISVVRR